MVKQDWSKVPRTVKDNKLKNRKSKRDIDRELKIKKLGGDPLEVKYGYPLEEELRQERMELLLDLMYPQRYEISKKKKTYKQKKATTFLTHLKREMKFKRIRARKSGTPFEIRVEDLFVDGKCPTVCPVFGKEFTWNTTVNDWTATVDRFNPEKGYVPGNVTLISHKANRIKNNGSVEDVEKVLKWMKNCN